jgi:hypothetical protein
MSIESPDKTGNIHTGLFEIVVRRLLVHTPIVEAKRSNLYRNGEY